jgi:hypothetical protein
VVHRYCYVGTILIADDDGRLNADPRFIKGQIFPYDDEITVQNVANVLKDLQSDKQLILYEISGSTYAQHPKWSDWQKIRADIYIPSKVPSLRQFRNRSVTGPSQDDATDKVREDKIKLGKDREEVFIFWNSQNVSKKRTLTPEIQKEISRSFETYSLQELKTMIETYATVLEKGIDPASKKYFWSHSWNLYEFLKRGLKQFDGKTPSDYLKKKTDFGQGRTKDIAPAGKYDNVKVTKV